MSIEIVPMASDLAAEIRGVDLAQDLDDTLFAQIEDAFDRYGVVFFRGQQITPGQQVAFGKRFGEVEHNYNAEQFGVAGHPELFTISNKIENGRELGPRRVGELWHTDMCYSKCPPRSTMLHAIEVPNLHGLALGDTAFAHAAAAFDALPAQMQQHIAEFQARFDFRGRKRGNPVSEEVANRYPPVLHPMVRTHPRTGRKSLYVMRDDCTGVEGLDDDEAQRLVEALADHIVHPDFIYRHRWQAGDLLMWDNCTVQHRALIDYSLPQKRHMHRLTIAGSVPV
ncbi:MAG: taurine dioxygenase [Gammaproteobacteria bacterium]|jgi:taurine dioxygenase